MEKVKKYLKYIFKTPMFIIFILIVIFYGGPALGKDAEIDEYAVITAIGLDKGEEGVDLSLLTFVPIVTQNFAEQYEVVKASGKTLAEAIEFAGLHLGRLIGLSHVKMVVLNEELFAEDVLSELDYLTRNANLALSTTIISTDAKAFDFLNTVKTFNTSSSIKADNLVEFNENYIYSIESTFETFYKGLYSPTNTELISFISLADENGEGIAIETSTQDSSSGGSQQGQNQKNKILNDGEALLCKNGKSIVKFNKEQMKNINLLKGNYSTGAIIIENFSDDIFTNARLTFEIFDNKNNYVVKFDNGIPIVYINSKVFVKLSEVQQEDRLIEENVEIKNISNEAIKALQLKLKEYMKEGIDILRENKADLIDLYSLLYNSHPIEMNRFMERLEDKDDFLNYVVFKVSPQIYSY